MITKEMILAKVSQEEICRKFFELAGGKFCVNKKITNPFREDKNPDCNFYYNTLDKLCFVDHACPEYNGDCFDIVRHAMGFKKNEFRAVLETIDSEFKLGIAPKSFKIDGKMNNLKKSGNTLTYTSEYRPEKNRPPTVFELKAVPVGLRYSVPFRNYFYDRSITERTLDYFEVREITELRYGKPIASKLLVNSCTSKQSIMIGFPIKEYYKNAVSDVIVRRAATKWQVYRPNAKRKGERFKSNAKGSPLLGFDKIPSNGDIVVITSGMKEIMHWYEQGIPAVAPIGENTNIPKFYLDMLRDSFTTIIVSMDEDEAGVKAANKILSKNLDFKIFNLPENMYKERGIKDIDEYILNYGKNMFTKIIKDAGIIN